MGDSHISGICFLGSVEISSVVDSRWKLGSVILFSSGSVGGYCRTWMSFGTLPVGLGPISSLRTILTYAYYFLGTLSLHNVLVLELVSTFSGINMIGLFESR